MASQYSHGGPRQQTGQQPDYRRLEQISMHNVDSLAAQVSRQANHTERILDPAFAIAAKANNTFRFHEFSEPRRHGLERSEIHLVPAAVVPPGELREKPTRVTVLREVQKALTIVFFHLRETDYRAAKQCLLL